MKWLVIHASGGAVIRSDDLPHHVGPFDTPQAASSWAFNRWGASATGFTVSWIVRPLPSPEDLEGRS